MASPGNYFFSLAGLSLSSFFSFAVWVYSPTIHHQLGTCPLFSFLIVFCYVGGFVCISHVSFFCPNPPRGFFSLTGPFGPCLDFPLIREGTIHALTTEIPWSPPIWVVILCFSRVSFRLEIYFERYGRFLAPS